MAPSQHRLDRSGPAFAQGAVNLVREVEEIRDDVAEVLG